MTSWAIENLLREEPEQSASRWVGRVQQSLDDSFRPDFRQSITEPSSQGGDGQLRTPSLGYEGSSMQDFSPPSNYMSRNASGHSNHSAYARPQSCRSYAHSEEPDDGQWMELSSSDVDHSSLAGYGTEESPRNGAVYYQHSYQPRAGTIGSVQRRQAASQYLQPIDIASQLAFLEPGRQYPTEHHSPGRGPSTYEPEATDDAANGSQQRFFNPERGSTIHGSEALQGTGIGPPNVRSSYERRTIPSSCNNRPNDTANLTVMGGDVPGGLDRYSQGSFAARRTSRTRSIYSDSGSAHGEPSWFVEGPSQNHTTSTHTAGSFQGADVTGEQRPSILDVGRDPFYSNRHEGAGQTDSDVFRARTEHSVAHESQGGLSQALRRNPFSLPNAGREVEIHLPQHHAQPSQTVFGPPNSSLQPINPPRSDPIRRARNNDSYRLQPTFRSIPDPVTIFSDLSRQPRRQPEILDEQVAVVTPSVANRRARPRNLE